MNDTGATRIVDVEAAAPRAPQPRGRLFRKYVALFVAVVAIALLANGLLEILFSYREHQDSLVRIQHEQAEAAAAKIGQFIKEIESQLGWTTQLPWSSATLEQRRVDALRLLRQVPAITELTQLDSSGHEQLRVSRLAMDVVGSGADLSKEPKFAEAVANKKAYYGPVYFRRESEPYMTLSLAGTSRAVGVSVAEVNLKFIWDVVSQIKVGEHGQAFVVDRSGRLIAHPDISLVLRNTDLTSLAQVKAALAGSAGTSPEEAQEARDLRGHRVLSAHAKVEPLGWNIFVELPLEEAYGPLYASIERSAGLLFGGLILAFLAGLLLARRMVVPIERLRAGAARLGRGELGERIAIKTGDELETLANQFNDMAGQLQESYADLENKVELRTHELSESLEQQTATADVLRVISSSPGELQPVFDTILDKAMRLCDAAFGVLWTYDGEKFRASALHGVPAAFAEVATKGLHPAGRGTSREMLLRGGALVHIADAADTDAYRSGEPLRRAVVDLGGARTLLGIPLRKDDELLGVFVIYRQQVQPFSDKQIALLESFAAQAVIAMENARLITETREALERQTATAEVLRVISSSPGELQPVFDAILANAARICEAQFGTTSIYDDRGFHVVASLGVPPAFVDYMRQRPHMTPTQRLVVETKRTQHIVDLMDSQAYRDRDPDRVAIVDVGGARTLLLVPMLKENELVGSISIYRQEVRPFTEKQIELVTSFAAQAVIALENVRLLNELRDRTTALAQSVEELRALGEVSHAVNSTLEVETVLQTIVSKAVQLSRTDAGTIYVFDDASQEFVLQATYGMDDALIDAIRHQRLGIDSAVVGDAARARAPVQVAELTDDQTHPVQSLITRAGFRALLVVPLLSPDGIIGALVVRRRETGEFSGTTIDLLQTFAAQSVVAIQNARLFAEIEEKGRQLELASRHKSQFLANMSHELRTPLNAVLGYSEMMLDGLYGDMPEKAKGVLERVQSNGRHLLGLINDVLDLSKIEAGQLTLAIEDYSMAALVKQAVATTESLARTKGLALSAKVQDGLPAGRGDERRLTQVLLNLIGNALKFTDKGEVAITAEVSDGRYTVAVRDTGPGIAEADQARIFEEFQQVDNTNTRKKGGTGLGLAIAKRIMEMHGGTLSVQSAPGQGSTFRMILPVRAQQGKEAA